MKTIQERFISLWTKIPRPYPTLAKLARNFDSSWSKPADILYLGDSVLERTSRDDTDKRTVDQMAADLLSGEKKLVCLSRAAYHLKVYYHLLSVLQSTRHKPKLVILPINMRSFSPQWASNPAWQFEEEIEVLKNYIKTRRISALKSNAEMLAFSEEERNAKLDLPYTDLKSIGQFVDLFDIVPHDAEYKFYRKKQIYIFNYLNSLSAEHLRLLYLGKILTLLQAMQIQVLVYTTPINYQGAVRHIGGGFLDIVRANVEVVRDFMSPYLENDGVRFLDLEEYLTSDYFFNPDEATEHLNQFGRAKLAQALIDEIRTKRELSI